MQLTTSFSALLSSLLLAIATVQAHPVDPLPRAQFEAGITLPLKRLHNPARSDVHPQILLQQHINRSHRRIAQMTSRAPPSDASLAQAVMKRAVDVGLARSEEHGEFHAQKRKVIVKVEEDVKANMRKAGEAKTKTKAAGGKTAVGGAVAGAAAGVAAAATEVPDTGSLPGISPLDVQAAESGSVADANAPTDSDSLGLDIDANDTGYLATVQIGTPPQDFLILMDSGSADFWVASTTCTSINANNQAAGACSATHKSLGAGVSSTFVDTGKAFSVTYGSGAVAGDVVTDDVSIAGLALKAHTFGTASEETVQFSGSDIPFDGLMGLAQQGLSQQGVPTPVESLASAGLIPAPITSFKLSRLADQLNDGEITFGSLDASKFVASTLTTLPNVNTEGFWEANLDAITVNGASTGLTGRTAILDTGTTLIIAPPADAAAVHALIPGAASDGQGGFTLPCTGNASVALTFGGRSFAIDPRDILFAPVDPTNLAGECVSGISAGEIGAATEWLVGDVFLKNAYFSVNQGPNTIQLAELATAA